MRSSIAADGIPTVYTPMLCPVAQGRKAASSRSPTCRR
ncbi:hypothetical protein [Xanthomonas nasturtii]